MQNRFGFFSSFFFSNFCAVRVFLVRLNRFFRFIFLVFCSPLLSVAIISCFCFHICLVTMLLHLYMFCCCSCVDDSGIWGHGGMLDALARLSSQIPEAYEHTLLLGDLHLLESTGEDEENKDGNANQWVALAVVQTYNPRRKVPRSSISIPELEQCLSKASFSAAQKSASIHMPRIGNQNGSDRSE
ncbi:putative DNA helicase [Helianthus anomalus]